MLPAGDLLPCFGCSIFIEVPSTAQPPQITQKVQADLFNSNVKEGSSEQVQQTQSIGEWPHSKSRFVDLAVVLLRCESEQVWLWNPSCTKQCSRFLDRMPLASTATDSRERMQMQICVPFQFVETHLDHGGVCAPTHQEDAPDEDEDTTMYFQHNSTSHAWVHTCNFHTSGQNPCSKIKRRPLPSTEFCLLIKIPQKES